MSRSIADRFDQLTEDDLQWREAELLALRLLYSSSDSEIGKTAILRSLTCLLYAHYEGYIKFVIRLWCEHFSRKMIKVRDLNPGLRYILLRPCMVKLATPKNSYSLEREWQEMIRKNNSNAYIESPLITSNLWPATLISCLEIFDLDCSGVNARNLTLKTLLSRRNEIAHGSYNVVSDISKYLEYESCVKDIIYDITLQLSSLLRNSKVRRRVRLTKVSRALFYRSKT